MNGVKETKLSIWCPVYQKNQTVFVRILDWQGCTHASFNGCEQMPGFCRDCEARTLAALNFPAGTVHTEP